MEFYEKVKNQFLIDLDKTSTLAADSHIFKMGQQSDELLQASSSRNVQLSPPDAAAAAYSLQKRHSTSYEQKFFANLGLIGRVTQDSQDETQTEMISGDDAESNQQQQQQLPEQNRHSSIAQQFLDLHEYSGEVVGGSALSSPTMTKTLSVGAGLMSLSRSSSRSSSVSSMSGLAGKLASNELDETRKDEKNVQEEEESIALKQSSLDGMVFGTNAADAVVDVSGVDSISMTSSGITPTTVINCLVPTIVVHETSKSTASKDQVKLEFKKIKLK